MDEVDKALEALKVHIKKEIVDNYFADRVYLEEEIALLQEEAQAYRQDLDLAAASSPCTRPWNRTRLLTRCWECWA